MTIYAFVGEFSPKSYLAFSPATGILWWLRRRDGGYYFDHPVVPVVATSFDTWLQDGLIRAVIDYPTVDEGL